MEYWTTLNFQLSNSGLELATHWIELAIPARTIYLGLVIWAGYKVYKQWRQHADNERG